jgi:type IV secretory pathway VirB10-like protein
MVSKARKNAEETSGWERTRSEVASRAPGLRRELWLAGLTVAVLGLAAAAWSASSSRSSASTSKRYEARTQPPQLDVVWDVGPPADEATEVERGCLDFSKVDPIAGARREEPRRASESDGGRVQPAVPAAWAEALHREAIAAAQRDLEFQAKRLASSMVVVDRPASDPAADGAVPVPGADSDLLRASESAAGPGRAASREDELLQRAALESVETVRAQRLAHPETTVAQGTLIEATLETGIQSDLPGMIRARVSAPVYSFTGELMVPRGSLLIGRYQSGLVRGQTRVFVVWTRLLRPDGISMQLASPAADELGRSGLPGDVDTHFFERFSSSFLLSLVDGGLAVAAANAQESDGATVVNASGRSFQSAAEIALENSVSIPPTVEIPRGSSVQVFVARDLDFAEPMIREDSPLQRDLP